MDKIAGIVIQILFLVLALVTMLMRLYVRQIQMSKRYQLPDALIVGGWFMLLGMVACNIVVYLGATGATNTVFDTSAELSMVYWIGNLFFGLGLFFPNAGFLAFYWPLFPTTLPYTRIAYQLVVAYLIAAVLTTICINMLWCIPLSLNWDLKTATCTVFGSVVPYATTWAFDITTNLTIFIPALLLLRHITLAPGQKAGFMATFTLASIVITIGIVRFIWFMCGLDIVVGGIWSAAEVSLSLVLACVPAIRSLIPPVHLTWSTHNGEVQEVKDVSGFGRRSEKEVDGSNQSGGCLL